MADTTTKLMLALAVMVAVAALMGRLAARLAQPTVVGELVGGIVLGPTLLGHFPGHVGEALISNTVRPELLEIGNLGVILYLFITGLMFDSRAVGVKGKQCAAVAAGAFGVPFMLAIPLALLLYSEHHGSDHHPVAQLGFVLFIGTAVSVTALPVLARILVDRHLEHSRIGSIALGAAAIQDIFGWLLLAASLASLVAGGLEHRIANGAACVALLIAIVYIAGPAVRRALGERAASPATAISVSLVGVALCAAAASALQLNAAIGAFVFGLALGRRWSLKQEVRARLEPLVLGLLLPVYFVSIGMKVNITSVSASALWELPAILAVAYVGKTGGTLVGVALGRLRNLERSSLVTMMNVRGLIELVVLSAGLSAGVLDQELYTLFVIMAVIATGSATPLLNWRDRRATRASDLAELAIVERAT